MLQTVTNYRKYRQTLLPVRDINLKAYAAVIPTHK